MNGKKILIIDDDPIILFMHKSYFDDISPQAEIICFENGKLAHEYILSHRQFEFLLLLDINMPIMNGWGLLDSLNTSMLDLQLTVFVVTSSVKESDKMKAYSYPMVKGFIVKPLGEADVLQSLNTDKN